MTCSFRSDPYHMASSIRVLFLSPVNVYTSLQVGQERVKGGQVFSREAQVTPETTHITEGVV